MCSSCVGVYILQHEVNSSKFSSFTMLSSTIVAQQGRKVVSVDDLDEFS
jgi:hypothetical protein